MSEEEFELIASADAMAADIGEKLGLSKEKVRAVFFEAKEATMRAIEQGADRIVLFGFITIEVVERAPRRWYDPQENKMRQLPAQRRLKVRIDRLRRWFKKHEEERAINEQLKTTKPRTRL